MWFRKVFVWGLLVCGVFSHSLMAEDTNQTKEYTFLKFFQDTKMAGDISTAVLKVGGYLKLDEAMIDALLASEVELYKGASRAVNANLGTWSNKSISFIKKGKEDLLKIIEQKDSSYHDIQAKFSNYLGTGLDILGAGLDAHDLGENLVKLWDNEGNPNIANWQRAMVNVGKVSQNVYGLTAETASLMGTFVPKGVIASSKYAQFFKNASVLNRTNFILLTLQLNSVAYSYFRDQEIDKILLYAGKEYQSKLSMRNLILDQLFKAYENDENVTKGEIGRILAHYPIFRPYSKAFLENFIVEKHFYALFNSTYLEKLFGVSDESSLTGFQRIVLALNALAHISAYEDDDYERRLNKMIDAFPDDNWLAGVENAIAGAFKGDDAYKIFNTEDFKRKTIPSYIVKNSSKMTAGTFYEMMYYNTFVGDIGTEAMKELEEIGKVVKNIKEKDIKYEEEPLNHSTLLLTLPNNATLNNNTLKA